MREYDVHPNQKRPIGSRALSRQAKYSLPSGLVVSFGQYRFAAFSCHIESAAPVMLPTAMVAKTAPFCSVVKPWRVVKTSGITLSVIYRTPQAKAAHKEKEKTTGSVARSLKGIVRER